MSNLKDKNKPALAMLIGAPLLIILLLKVGLTETKTTIDYVTASGITVIVTAVLVMFADMVPHSLKHKVIFLRLRNELPAHRCNKICFADSRLDANQLKTGWPEVFGDDVPAKDRNNQWYQHIYKPVINEPQVLSAHAKFLLYRDATAGSIVILLLLVVWSWTDFNVPYLGLAHPWSLRIDVFFVIIQWISAQTYGKRLVVNATARRME